MLHLDGADSVGSEIGVIPIEWVGKALAVSAALAYDERRIAAAFDKIEPLATTLMRRQLPFGPKSTMLEHIGEALLIQKRLASRVDLDEKPDVLWDHPELERLWAKLVDEYDLAARARAMERKLAVISRDRRNRDGAGRDPHQPPFGTSGYRADRYRDRAGALGPDFQIIRDACLAFPAGGKAKRRPLQRRSGRTKAARNRLHQPGERRTIRTRYRETGSPQGIPSSACGVRLVFATDAIETDLGRKPEQLSADSGYCSNAGI